MNRNAIAGGILTFHVPYAGRAKFDWWLDAFGHGVVVECTSPWKGLYTDVHKIGMAPKFTVDEARQLAETLCRKIVGNLESVIENWRDKDSFKFGNFYDDQQLPLYRKWAWEEQKRRLIEVDILAEDLADDDCSCDVGVVLEEHRELAKEHLTEDPVEVVKEIGPLSGEEMKARWAKRENAAKEA